MAREYGVFHDEYQVANRGYFLVDRNMSIRFKSVDGFSLLKEQTKTLLDAIDQLEE